MSRPARSRPHHDVVAGAFLLGFSAAAFWLTTGFREVPAMLSQNVPPTFFPRLVLAAIVLLSLLLAGSGLRRPPDPPRPVPGRVYATGGILLATVALVSWLGTLPAVVLVSIGLPLYWGERRALRIVALAIALPLVVHLLFTVALGMRFPRGVLW